MKKQINWFIYKILGFILEILLFWIPKDKNLWLFGISLGDHNTEYFMHNSKYLFLYVQNIPTDIKTVWLCNDEMMLQKFKQIGFKNVYKRFSLKGFWSIIRAKYWFYDFSAEQVSKLCNPLSKFIGINLWHGTGGLKKSANDADLFKGKVIQKIIYRILKVKDNYYTIDNTHEIQFRKTQFGAQDNQIVISGSPRLDVLYREITYSDLFMEKDYEYIKNIKEQGKKLLFYTPTFRDTGKNISGWLKSEKLHEILKDNNAVLICKLHFADKNSLNFELPEEIYKMDSRSDIYPVLKYADCLISDYSSIYFDFLLLDKPIIYHVPDLEEYQEQCRGFYEPYENLSPGIKTRTDDEIIEAMKDVVNGIDNFKESRKKLTDQTFKFQDGRNCERIVDWIKNLNESTK